MNAQIDNFDKRRIVLATYRVSIKRRSLNTVQWTESTKRKKIKVSLR